MNTSFRKFLALAAACALAIPAALGAPLKAGDRFLNLADLGLEGSLPDLAGKVVIVDLWASWCGPCKKAMPVLKELHETYSPKGVAIVAISLDEKKADMEAFLKKNPVPFATLRDGRGELGDKLGVSGIPTSFVVTPDGRVHAIHEGFGGDASKKKYIAEIEELLRSSAK